MTTGWEPVCFFVARRNESGITLLLERTSDGSRAVLVFDEDDRAEAFRIIEGLGPEWETMEKDAPGATELLGVCASEGVRYVVQNPPSALTRGEGQSRLVPIGEFVVHLLGQ